MSFEVRRLDIPDVVVVRPVQYKDARGLSSETYSRRVLAGAGIDLDFVQDFQSNSIRIGTIRGLHFQTPPFAQGKLIRVLKGKIFDVAVDLRRSSPTFGKYVSAEISADSWEQIFIPAGFAHGLCTLEANTSVLYKLSSYYSPEHERGIRWDDPDIGIIWPVDGAAQLSDKDLKQPYFRDVGSVFD